MHTLSKGNERVLHKEVSTNIPSAKLVASVPIAI